MATFTVTVRLEVDGASHEEAAKRAYSLIHDLPPTEFTVVDAGGAEQTFDFDDDEVEAIKKAAFDGTLFPRETP